MAVIKPILKLTNSEVKREYPDLLETFEFYFPKATEYDITLMVCIATGVCPACYENPRGCQCWNDE